MEKLFRLRQSSGYGRIIDNTNGQEVPLLELSSETPGAQQLYESLKVLMMFTSDSTPTPTPSHPQSASTSSDIPIPTPSHPPSDSTRSSTSSETPSYPPSDSAPPSTSFVPIGIQDIPESADIQGDVMLAEAVVTSVAPILTIGVDAESSIDALIACNQPTPTAGSRSSGTSPPTIYMYVHVCINN
jgi:cytoskeletal protein RodZ